MAPLLTLAALSAAFAPGLFLSDAIGAARFEPIASIRAGEWGRYRGEPQTGVRSHASYPLSIQAYPAPGSSLGQVPFLGRLHLAGCR